MLKNLSSSYPRRKDFEKGSHLLKEYIESGRFRIAHHLEQEFDSLSRVRILPNGRLNLDTVDELVRTNFSFLISNPFDREYETNE